MRKLELKYIVFLLILGVLVSQCRRKDIISTNSSHKLAFSSDTILFDTVFTTVGSTTQRFKIYNNENVKLVISNIQLEGGGSSNYRMNVDGVSTLNISDIEIEPNDSLFIFVEVTLDPNNINTPLVVEDRIRFETNGNQQHVQLVAWGQDAYFHQNELVCGELWSNDKPHVIYGFTIVDSTCILNISKGTQIYMHANSNLIAYKSKINILGNKDERVVFQGDRLEEFYDDVPGQWGRIWLIQSTGSVFNYVTVKNGTIGIQVDTSGTPGTTLLIENSIIDNMSAACLFSQGGSIRANNCLFGNAGQYSAALTLGGEYNMNQCTFGNYWTRAERKEPLFLLNNWYEDINKNIIVRPLNNTKFENCIFYGAKDNEFSLDTLSSPNLDFIFNHSIVKVDEDDGEKITNTSPFYNGMIVNKDPLLKNPTMGDFTLLPASPAKDKADASSGLSIDLNGDPRDALPDVGCYEVQ